MNEDACTCELGEYPDFLCPIPGHGRYARPVTLIEAARYHPKFGNTPLEQAILKRWKGGEAMRAEILGVKSAARIIIDTAIGILQETDAAYWSRKDYHLPKIKGMIERLEMNVQAVRLAYETATKVQEVSHE